MGFLLVSDIITMARRQMDDAGIPDSKNDAEALYCFMKRIDRSKFFMQWSEPADDLTCERYFDLVARRCSREPLQLITGETQFMDLIIKTRPGVLIPRMDSEIVAMTAELLLKEMKHKNVLDLCSGSGILGIYLGKRLGAKVTACDISSKAVEATNINAKINGVKVEILQGDLFQPVKRKKYNLIVSNPPYIKSGDIAGLMPEVRDHDPIEALDGGEDGLDFYRRIIEEAPLHLKKDGAIVLEIGDKQGYPVTEMLEKSEFFDDIKLMKDMNHLNRVVAAKYVGK